MKTLLMVLLVGVNASATQLSCKDAQDTVTKRVGELISETYPNLEFEGLTIDALGAEFPKNCDYISFDFPKRIDLSSDLIIRFDAFKNEKFQKRTTKVFRFKGHAKIFRSAKIIQQGNPVTSESVYPGKIRLSKVNQHHFSEFKSENYQYRNFIDKDQVIESWMIEKKPDVFMGDLVSAIVKKNNITLTLDGRILENGYIGEDVKLKLSKNNKVLLGTLHDKKTVIISRL